MVERRLRMKILVVDRNLQKYSEILQFFKERKIEMKYASSSMQAKFILLSKKDDIDGIIIGVDIPDKPKSETVKGQGEKLIREIEATGNITDILLVADRQVDTNIYDSVVGTYDNWNDDQNVFLLFMKRVIQEKLSRQANERKGKKGG